MICTLCPRACGIDRKSSLGFCRQSDEIRAARAAPHFWEEPCLSGKNGSGTVFFCGCTLRCVYCQNAAISGGESHGKTVTPRGLADIFLRMEREGLHNVNLVTPTMFAPQISRALTMARADGLTLPVVYNTSGYERTDALSAIAPQIDIYLPDFKYLSPEIAEKYSGAADYPDHAKASLAMMVRHIGEAKFDGDGMMKKGVIVRHLLLPGQLRESMRVLDYLYGEYENAIFYSLMSQYTPMPGIGARYPELARRVTTYEYEKLIDHALSLGIKNGFMQDGRSAKESFIPAFNGEGV
ncbi:MAG: radical SAM protein [Ruminococcaceae bacterium]|nr:radical SAM protein [Oscillospiraceae bacterium]